MNTHDTRSPDEIERDIKHTQDDMSQTIDRLGDQFTPRNIVNALFDKAEANDIDARRLYDGARRNPLALGLLSAGAIWLVSDYDAHPRAFTSEDRNGSGNDRNRDMPDFDTSYERDHRSYVAHMTACERRDGEDDAAYRRRRDDARGTFLMIERGHDEDEKSYRQRLDEATDSLRDKRDRMAQQARENRDRALEKARDARDRLSRGSRRSANRVAGAYNENPVIGGLIAAVIGMVAGSAAPASRQERQAFGDQAEQAVDGAKSQGERLAEDAREAKDKAVSRAQNKLEPEDHTSSSSTSAPRRTTTPRTSTAGATTAPTSPETV
ncbi:DUF3618 domain-containing protein [Erythrobacter sp.]|jgi:hypothetical protein|uniref:DUF3618 domain-containing protein n=1 Tax=Erythrobacter sp. TaxID=1042 RepID=UPI002E9DC51C|nr:DUF3618 domain-containing protein [Erythrobacter sp.]